MGIGLDNVVAAETVLSEVDGLAGRLVIRGYELREMAGWRYEDVLALLWEGFFPDLPDTAGLAAALGTARVDAFAMLSRLDRHLAPFDAIRVFVAAFPDSSDLATALALVAGLGVALPAIIRLQAGKTPIAPDPRLGHAADILRMLEGTSAAPARIAALDAYLVTVADHGLNASTFAARIVASTQAGLTSSALAALGALKGPLHGGAPGPVLDMLDAIGTSDHAEMWIGAELARGNRLMGFGHRIYRVRDPRADALNDAITGLGHSGQIEPARLAFARHVEAVALAALKWHKPERPLETNVEFFTALLLEALGFPRQAFTSVFAASRIGGWIAHSREQALGGRLIRPKSLYVGPTPRRAA